MPNVIFDIETGPLPLAEIEHLFDESSIKFGNTKDEEKRAAKVEEERTKFVERAALSPLTGRVLAIGYLGEKGPVIQSQADFERSTGRAEEILLECFWKTFRKIADRRDRLIGFNIEGFDLPFLCRRSWMLGVKLPESIIEKNRYWHATFIDLLSIWKCGNYGDASSLDAIAKAMGVGEKPDGVSGADFARLWETDRAAAEAYLVNDLEMTAKVAERMGVG